MKLLMRLVTPPIILLAMTFIGCDKEGPDMNGANGLDKFLGEFKIQSNHISGIHTFYDSIGNVLGMGFDTMEVSSELLSIDRLNQADTVFISGLINSLQQNGRTDVEGVLENDSIKIIHEFSTPMTRNDYIRGKIWRENDSIFLNYQWNKSDTWSSSALPERGEVVGIGILEK